MTTTTNHQGQPTTVKSALAAIRAMGATAGRTSYAEFRVNIPSGTEATAYYTQDGADAVATARDMMRRYHVQMARRAEFQGDGNGEDYHVAEAVRLATEAIDARSVA